jgi:hypothetical protein
MQARSNFKDRPVGTAALSLCVAAAMLSGCKPVASDAALSLDGYEAYGAGTIGAYEMRLSRLVWPRALLESR